MSLECRKGWRFNHGESLLQQAQGDRIHFLFNLISSGTGRCLRGGGHGYAGADSHQSACTCGCAPSNENTGGGSADGYRGASGKTCCDGYTCTRS